MTINTNPARNEYTANAGQTEFNYTFKIYANTDLNVYVTPAGQTPDCPTDLTTSYTVSGVGLEDGGVVTLNTPTGNGDLVTIVSAIPDNRTTDYQDNGDFLPDTVNNDFDRILSLQKQTEDLANRTAWVTPECEQGPKPYVFSPTPNTYLGFDGSGNPVSLTAPTSVEADLIEVNSITALRSVVAPTIAGQLASVLGYYGVGDNGGGLFSWDENSTLPDDGGLTILPNGYVGVGRWRRRWEGPLNFAWFGCGGGADDTAQFQAVMDAAGGGQIIGNPSDVYRIVTTLTTPAKGCIIDLNGATIDAEVTAGELFTSPAVTLQSYTVTTQTGGSNDVILSAPPAGLSVGDYVMLQTDALGSEFPMRFRRVRNIVSSTVTVDSAYDISYPGNVTLVRIDFIADTFALRNGIIECGDMTSAADDVIDIGGYVKMHIDGITLRNADLGTTGNKYGIKVFFSLNAQIENCSIENCILSGAAVELLQCAEAVISDNYLEGDFFGANASRCDSPIVQGNYLIGRFNIGSVSVRGIKIQGCQGYTCSENIITDFDTGIRINQCGRGTISANTVLLCGIVINDIAASIEFYGNHIIDGNIVSDSHANGILTSSTTYNVTVCNNISKNSSAAGILVQGDGFSVHDNSIIEWDIGSVSAHAIDVSFLVTSFPCVLMNNRAETATPAKNGYRINFFAQTVVQSGNRSNTTNLFSSQPPDSSYYSSSGALTDNKYVDHDSMFCIQNNGGTLEHAFRNSQNFQSAPTDYFTRGITGAQFTFVATPTGNDATTAFASGAKLSSALPSRIIFDTAAQSALNTDFNSFSGSVTGNNSGTILQVTPNIVSRDVNGTTIQRLELDFYDAATGTSFNLTTLPIGALVRVNMNASIKV